MNRSPRGQLAALVLLIGSIVLTGCATTATIQASRDVSTSGLAYTQTVDQLLDATITESIDFNTTSLIKSRRNLAPEVLASILEANNEAVLALLTELESFRRQNKLLAAYFQNLQALADSNVEDDVGGSVAALSNSISDLNEARGAAAMLSAEQNTQIGALAGLAARSVQAGKLKNALERDAEIIAVQLVLHENQLANIGDMLADQFEAENELFYNEEVRAPYIDVGAVQSLPGEWRTSREQHLRASFANERLRAAQEAAKQLRGVWTSIVQGGNDIGSLRILLSDIDEFFAAAKAVQAGFDDP